MSRKLKRAIWGYAPDSFHEELRVMQADHQERMTVLQAQAEELERTNEDLRREIARIHEKIEESPDEANKIGHLFLEAHLEQTKSVYELQEELKQIEEKHGEVLEISQIHREAVVQQVLDQLRHLEAVIQLRAKEGDSGGAADF